MGSDRKKGLAMPIGVNRGSEVLTELGQRRFCRGTSTTDSNIAFKDRGRNPGASENDRGRETVWARADDGCGWHTF